MESLLQVESLSTGYGDLRVVWDVSFEVPPSGVIAILGRNGAGKTTTLRAIAGLNPVTSGRILFDGKDVSRQPPYQRSREGLGYVQEGKRIFRQMTVEENLRAGTLGVRFSRKQLAEQLDRAYSTFPILAERKQRIAGELSGGQQQMLAIATAIMPQPRLLLVDEPSGGLAPAIVGDVMAALQALGTQGFTIVLVEQSVDFALALAETFVVLDLGHVVHTGRSDAPDARTIIQEAYLGRLEEPRPVS